MVQELDNIISLTEGLNSQAVAYTNSVDGFITSINSKISLLEQKSASPLSEAYYEELLKSLQSLYSKSLNNFSDIEKSLLEICILRKETLNEELKDGFITSKNIHDFFEFGNNANKRIKEILKNKIDISQTKDELKEFNHAFKSLLEESMKDIISILSELNNFEWTDKKSIVDKYCDIIEKGLASLYKKLLAEGEKNAVLEKLLSNTVTDEKLKITSAILDCVIEKTNDIYKQLQKNNTEHANNETILHKTITESEKLISYTNKIKQTLGKITRNIDSLPDTTFIDKTLQNIYSILCNISEEIIYNKIHDDFELNSKITSIKEDFSTIKNIITDLNEVLISKINSNIKEIKINSIKELISKMILNKPQKEDIEYILKENSSKLTEANNTNQNIEQSFNIDSKKSSNYEQQFTNSEKNAEDLISKLYNQQDNDGKINKFEELKNDLIASQKGLEENILLNLSNINEKLNNDINIEGIKNEIINDQSINQNELINKLSEITTIIENNLQAGDFVNFTEDLKNQINEISIQINKNIENSLNNKKDITDSIEKYFSEIKEFVTELKPETSTELKDLISNIENKIEECQNKNQNYTERAFTLENNSNEQNFDFSENIKSSLREFTEIKKQIEELGKTFKNINTNNISEANIKQFILSKMHEVCSDIERINTNLNDTSENIKQGFLYSTQLFEQKYNILLDLIKELRHASTDNIELFERLTVADNKLMDFKQEIDLVNTDITNILNSKTEEIIETIKSIKETVKEAPVSVQTENDNFKSILEEIHNLSKKISLINQDGEYSVNIENNGNYFDDLYEDISQKLDDTKDNIRDFILGDIDSVIIKVDNIKDYLTDKLESIVPPNPEEMKELNQFVSQIADFKQENEAYLKRIENSINEKHDELKSMLTVALNNKEILNAIKNLKEYFNSKINDFEITEDDNIFEEEDSQFENNQEVVTDLKENFGRIANQIDSLSGQNSDIEYILNNIYDKIDSIKLDNNSDDKKLVGENNFDFIKAFDLLSDDIKTLKNSVNKVIQEGDKKYSLGAETAYSKISSKLEDILKSAKNEWLEEIKNYLTNNELKTLISEINNKIDIIALTNNSEDENNSDVKNLLDVLNAKVDILAENDNISEFEELKDSIESLIQKLEPNNSITKNDDDKNTSKSEAQIISMLEALNSKIDIIVQSDNYEQIEELSDSDAQITSMLETLNHKIDILAQTDTSIDTEDNFEDIKQLILDQKDYIDKLEPSEKLDTFKKCLDKLSLEINNIPGDEIHKTLKDMKESIMETVVTIFNQISFVEESEDIKDFVEEKTEKIAKNLEEVTRQIKQIAFSDDSEDYNYSMQDIETDLAKLRIALNDLSNNAHLNQTNDELTNIADTLNRITYAVDTLSQDEIQDLKTDITNLKEQTRQLLMSSDASFSTINNDIVYKVDNVAQLLEKSHDSDKVMRQALIYMGEWIDSASESMNKISSNSDEIINIKSTLEERFDDQQKHLNHVEKQITKIENLEAKFEQQEARIDRLEENLDKILSVVEDIDNSGLMRKVDKIEKQLTKLSSNIEKLTSYVDG